MSIAQLPPLSERPWDEVGPAAAAALRPGIGEMSEEIIAAVSSGVPAYARPLEGSFGRNVRTGVERALSQFMEMIEQPGSEFPEREVYVRLGRGEAREGRTLEALLSAYRIGARVAWRRIGATGREAGLDAGTLSLLAEAIFAYIDELSAQSAEGFAQERLAAAGELERRRAVLLERLIEGPPADRAEIEGAARDAGWEPPDALAVLVWLEPAEPRNPPALPAGSIATTREDGSGCALIADPDAPGRRAEIERAMRRRDTPALGPTVPWIEAWRSAQRAVAAHRLTASTTETAVSETGLTVADDHAAELILHSDPGLLNELAERRLMPLSERSPGARAKLLETLAAWLEHQGRIPDIAEALHIHRQTVRYRLAQLREDFGDALDDPGARFELQLALRSSS